MLAITKPIYLTFNAALCLITICIIAGLTLFAILFHKYRHHSGGNTSTNTSTNKTKCNQSQSISISALCHIKQILHTHRITVHVQLNFQFQ